MFYAYCHVHEHIAFILVITINLYVLFQHSTCLTRLTPLLRLAARVVSTSRSGCRAGVESIATRCCQQMLTIC